MRRKGRKTRPSSSSQRRRLPNANKTPAIQGWSPVHAVLGQPELLEIILDFATHDIDVETKMDTLCGVRLVNKTWLESVTRLFRTNKEPMFQLKLIRQNSTNGTPYVIAKGKLLDEFAKTIANRVLKQPFPTFSLKIMTGFFQPENYEGLVAFLGQCAEGLVKLTMFIPDNAGTLPDEELPMVELPRLHFLSVPFTLYANSENELDFWKSAKVIQLVNSFLNKAQSLKEFSVPWFGKRRIRNNPILVPPLVPLGFENITFPVSLTTLDLRCLMTSEKLEILVRNKLPNLLTLTLNLEPIFYAEGLLSNIFTNFSEHLRTLNILGLIYSGPRRVTNFVRFSVMKNLTCLSTNEPCFELEDNHPMLEKCFPKLEELDLFHQTPEMLRKWVNGKPLKSVKILRLSLIDENETGFSSEYIISPSLENLQAVHLTFPHVCNLTLKMANGTNAGALKYVFMQMRQLTCLKIQVHKSESSIINSDYWDSVLTGAPLRALSLRKNSDYWRNFELKDSEPSIKMLTELQTLSLQAFTEGLIAKQATEPLISDVTFALALLKMPKLNNLNLYGRFYPSRLMTELWKETGRRLAYIADHGLFKPIN